MHAGLLLVIAGPLLLLSGNAAMAQAAETEQGAAGPVQDAAEPAPPTGTADFFVVEGVAFNDLLNIRATASAGGKVVGRLPNGVALRNLGCDDVNSVRWCKIESVEEPKLVGWAASRYLREMHIEEAGDLPPPAADGGEPPVDVAAPVEAAVPGGSEATSEIPCARYYGQPMTLCGVTAERVDDQEAVVTVTWPDGGARVINFRNGRADSSDSADPLSYTREAELNLVRIGKAERFEILDKVPFGDRPPGGQPRSDRP